MLCLSFEDFLYIKAFFLLKIQTYYVFKFNISDVRIKKVELVRTVFGITSRDIDSFDMMSSTERSVKRE